ncbi:MAG: CHAT domain-containing protein [Desulfobaccales bacterium]
MSLHILLVFPEAQIELARDMRDLLEDNPLVKEADGEVKIVRNVKTAWECLRQSRYDFIVAFLHLPPDRASPLDLSAQLGLDFLQSLKKESQHIPSILVAPARDDNIDKALETLPECKLAFIGESLSNDVLDHAQKYLQKVTYQEPASQPTYYLKEPAKLQGDIEIKLHLGPGFQPFVYGEYTMFTEYKKIAGQHGQLWLDWRTLKELAKKSKALEDPEVCSEWLEELKNVGESLWREFCRGFCDRYTKFKEHFNTHVKQVNGIENTRIRFKMDMVDKEEDEDLARVSEEMQAVVLEALKEDQKEFLMLQAPIYRRLDLTEYEYDSYPLFDLKDKDKEAPINCLIIEADTSGWVEELRKNLPELSHILGEQGESRLLEAYFQQKRGQGRIGKILRLAKDLLPKNTNFTDWVFEVLEQDGPWQLVHYAGHSLYGDDRTGYVFFPGENTPEPVKIGVFSTHLRNSQVRFMYLSSCQSSEDDFVFQLANNRVPAILGFRWSIDDEKAKEYALKFYEYLFEYRSLDQAFLKARQYAHKYKDNRIWAAPLLVLQSP